MDMPENVFTDLATEFDDIPVKITQRYIDALIELMAAEIEMMKLADPDYADCWHWARCHVNNLAYEGALSFSFGGEEDDPEDDMGQFGVIVVSK